MPLYSEEERKKKERSLGTHESIIILADLAHAPRACPRWAELRLSNVHCMNSEGV